MGTFIEFEPWNTPLKKKEEEKERSKKKDGERGKERQTVLMGNFTECES